MTIDDRTGIYGQVIATIKRRSIALDTVLAEVPVRQRGPIAQHAQLCSGMPTTNLLVRSVSALMR